MFEAFFIASVIYFIINFTLTRILLLVEKKMDGPKEYTVHGSQNMTAEERKRLNESLRGRKL
jgi:putative lysine transport system permease protein